MVKRTMAAVGFALLVVIDVVLVVVAWNHVRPDESDARVSDPATAPAEESSATATTTPTESGDDAEAEPADGYASALVEGELLARAAVRSCAEEATAPVEVSDDGGASWAEYDVPLSSVVDLTAASSSELVAVGADEQCAAAAYASADGGETWESTDVEGAGWAVVDEARLVSPGGELPDVGCTPEAVSGVSAEDAVVLCADGGLLTTTDGGAFWEKQTTLPFATEVAFTSEGEGYVLVARGGCNALVRSTTDGGVTWEDVECISTTPPVDVAADGDVLVVVGADGTYRSEDRGENWQVR